MDDMMGLEFGEYDGLGAWLDTEVLYPAIGNTLIMGAGGAAAGIGVGMALEALQEKVEFLQRKTYMGKRLQTAAFQTAIGVVAGMYSGRLAAGAPPGEEPVTSKALMGAAVGLGVLAAINIWNAVVAKEDAPIALNALPEDMELSSLSEGDYSESMEALAELEATGVSTAPGAFQGFADPTVTPEALMGFNGTVTQEETLGAYAPYLS